MPEPGSRNGFPSWKAVFVCRQDAGLLSTIRPPALHPGPVICMVREPDVRAEAGIRGIAMYRGMRHACNGNRYDGLCFFSIGPAGRESGNNSGRAPQKA
ncbi:hypothetical protein LHK_01597 [Laribacter hongkongensis HLHK9]|uniref:Uncharacterized protein n=1 Tax=Laribacter hongkongensis (strain HLHK9) TaxID=557598 RepID=C1D7Z4_LARHH|nr:hypothetical protein LHK_01597 [Laribacter hongkongensis HLHK9]